MSKGHLIAGAVCVLLVGCGPDTVESVEGTSDQTTLARIAVANRKARVRCAAAAKLTDQALLAKIALEDNDIDVRRVAVERLTDQALLAEVAVHDKDRNEVGVEYFRSCLAGWLAVEKVTDRALLVKIAVEGADGRVCGRAVMKLRNQSGNIDQTLMPTIGMWVDKSQTERVTDQALLFKIAVGTPYSDSGRVAVEKLADQSLLADFVRRQLGPADIVENELRRIAVAKLTDQALLAKFAQSDMDPGVRIAAAKMLTDQAALAKIALESTEAYLRRIAVGKLTDQALLATIALESGEADECSVALERLTDQALLAKIVVDSQRVDIRVKAIGKVTDQVSLRQWAENAPQAAVRQASVRRIADDRFLLDRLPSEPSPAARGAVIETLRGTDSLREVALTAFRREDRERAFRRLRERGQVAPDLVSARRVLADRVRSLAAESDHGMLVTVTLDGEFEVLRDAAARRLSDPAALEQTTLRCRDREVLKVLLTKLTDKSRLNRVAAAAADRAMRVAAAQSAIDRFTSNAYDLVIEGESYRPRLKPRVERDRQERTR